MPTNREKLVADWHTRLAAAQEAPADVSSRAAWLSRLRLRLYRFLLSLYGEGTWNAAARGDGHERGEAAVLKAGTVPLGGKPAKDVATIREAISKVAQAQDARPAAGPLTGGIDRDQWMVVAARSGGIDPELASEVLKLKLIPVRVERDGRDVVMKVPMHHWAAAHSLLDERRAEIEYRSLVMRPTQTANRAAAGAQPTAASLLMYGIAVGPLLGVVAVGLMALFWPDVLELPTPSDLLRMFFLVWLSSALVMWLLYPTAALGRK